MTQDSLTPARLASRYAQGNYKIFPVYYVIDGKCSCGNAACPWPGKHPKTEHGHLDATNNITSVSTWWESCPDANIGYRPEDNEIVIDVEAEGLESHIIEELEKKFGPLPATRNSNTGGGGRHLFFMLPVGEHRIKSQNRTFPDVDIKTHTGYVILPPSNHVSGGSYSWNLEDGMGMAKLPDPWVKGIIEAQDKGKGKRDGKTRQKYTPGSRNEDLFSMACAAVGNNKDRETVLAELLTYNRVRVLGALPEEDVYTIVKSAMKYAKDQKATSETKAACGEAGEDKGHAEDLYEYWLENYRWDKSNKTWMGWTGKRWEITDAYCVTYVAAQMLEAGYSELLATARREDQERWIREIRAVRNFGRITGALSFLKGMPGIGVKAEQWDTNAWIMNFQNGTLDLHTGKLRPHDRADLCRMIANVDHDPNATGTTWDDHMKLIIPNDNLRRQVQRDLGRAMIGEPLVNSIGIWFGDGANGRSTTIMTWEAVFGDYVKMAVQDLLIQKTHSNHPTEWADISGARWVFSEEIDEGKKLAEGIVKSQTGGTVRKARLMHCDFFNVKQTYDIFLVVNHKPIITGRDLGIWRRINPIPFLYSIPLDDQQPQSEVVRTLTSCGSHIVNWAIAGLRDWENEPKWVAKEAKEAKTAYKEEQDVLAPFLANCCKINSRASTAFGELYKAYERFCGEENETLMSRKAFGHALTERKYTKKPVGDKNILTVFGLALLGPTTLQGGDLDEEVERA